MYFLAEKMSNVIGIVYIVYNINNLEKYYIGQTRFDKEHIRSKLKFDAIHKRQKQHMKDSLLRNSETRFHRAIRKTPHDWYFEVLEYCRLNELNEKEQFYIKKFDSYKSGYNSTSGGQSGYNATLTAEHKRNISTGIRTSMKYRHGMKNRNFFGKNNPFYGKTHSKKFKNYISKRNKTLMRGNQYTKGMKFYNNGEKETCCFENNVPIGFVIGRLKRKWITNGKINTQILIHLPIPEGFYIGRIKKG